MQPMTCDTMTMISSSRTILITYIGMRILNVSSMRDFACRMYRKARDIRKSRKSLARRASRISLSVFEMLAISRPSASLRPHLKIASMGIDDTTSGMNHVVA